MRTVKDSVRKMAYFVLEYFPKYVAPSVLTNLPFAASFFLGYGNPLKSVPHVKSKNPLGFTALTPELIQVFRNAAGTEGVATAYLGPVLAVYIGNNARRNQIIRESEVGVVDEKAARIIGGLTSWNNVLRQSLVYTPLKKSDNTANEKYVDERNFLKDVFTNHPENWLEPVLECTHTFLNELEMESDFSIHEIARNSMLRIISTWMKIKPVDRLCKENPTYFEVIDGMARYAIGQVSYDAVFEAKAMQFGMKLLEENLDALNEAHFFGMMFTKRGLTIPKTNAELEAIDKIKLKDIVMNIMSTVFGGGDAAPLICEHALARLLADRTKLEQFKLLAREIDQRELTHLAAFHSTDSSKLRFLCEHVMETIFQCPPFAAQIFPLSRPLNITVQNAAVMLPAGSVLLADYLACNQHEINPCGKNLFSERLDKEDTVRKFRMSEWNASCGGSKEGYSRRCPVMVEAVYAITIFLYRLLNGFDIAFRCAQSISLESDPAAFPVNKRKDNDERIALVPVAASQAPRYP